MMDIMTARKTGMKGNAVGRIKKISCGVAEPIDTWATGEFWLEGLQI